ncbi:hypothetical protein F5148DRAFT_1160532 [Russula earlei]|uniref:Uncharacterized protein n=1 Tax=Russula earlei TaxID=71964 RepID=A0ACC0UNJ3_9AGAM|nr:hypothetical protein F5148DRAFT_1160532 [Russula earlei]
MYEITRTLAGMRRIAGPKEDMRTLVISAFGCSFVTNKVCGVALSIFQFAAPGLVVIVTPGHIQPNTLSTPLVGLLFLTLGVGFLAETNLPTTAILGHAFVGVNLHAPGLAVLLSSLRTPPLSLKHRPAFSGSLFTSHSWLSAMIRER